MKNLTLKDLYNPSEIKEIMIISASQRVHLVPGEDQAFQEYPKTVELWQLQSGSLYRIRMYRKKSVIFYKYESEDANWEQSREYIKPKI